MPSNKGFLMTNSQRRGLVRGLQAAAAQAHLLSKEISLHAGQTEVTRKLYAEKRKLRRAVLNEARLW